MMADSPMRARSHANVLSTLLAQQHPLSVQEIEDIQHELSSALTHPDRLLKLNEASNEIVESYKPSSTDDNTAKILQVFLEFLSKHGQLALMLDIETIGRDDAKLKLLAKHLVDAILKPMKLAGGVKSHVSATSSPVLTIVDVIADSSTQLKLLNGRSLETMKAHCLQRDGFRCAYSHIFDRRSAFDKKIVPPADAFVQGTHLTHILPLGLGTFNNADGRQKEASDVLWFALYRYFPGLKEKIDPETLNQYQNLVTFAIGVHATFDGYFIAFDPLPQQIHRYEIKWFTPWPIGGATPPQGHQDVMTLSSKDPRYPLPDPEFFRAHCQVSAILEASGIGYRIDAELGAAEEDPENLDPDGSTDVGSILRRRMLMDV